MLCSEAVQVVGLDCPPPTRLTSGNSAAHAGGRSAAGQAELEVVSMAAALGAHICGPETGIPNGAQGSAGLLKWQRCTWWGVV